MARLIGEFMPTPLGQANTPFLRIEAEKDAIMYKRIMLAIFTTVIIRAGVLAPASSSAHPLSAALPIKMILVQARVIHLDENDGFIVGTLEITHVYCGPDKLLGNTFVAHSPKSMQGNGFTISPPLKPGEKGIWSLKEIDDKLIGLRYPEHGVVWPVREGENTYSNATALAQVIEQVCTAESAEQLDLLQRYAFDRIPEISVWAIHVMSQANPEDKTRLFNDLVSNIDSLSIPGQAALDQVLSEIEDTPWRTSKKRLVLFNKWVSKAMSKDDAALIISRLDVAAQHSELEDKTILKLLEIVIGNKGIPPVARLNGIRLVGFITKRDKDDGLGFEILVRIIKDSDEENFKMIAAHTIKNNVSIDGDRFSIIQSLRAQTTDKNVADPLEYALKHPRISDRKNDN